MVGDRPREIACVRDRFSGDEMARTMSLVLTIFLFTPIVAPFLGTFIYVLLVIAIVLFLVRLISGRRV